MKLAEVDDAHEDCVFVSWLMFVILALNTARIATIATSYYICNYYNFKLIREYKKEPIILIYLFISNLCCYMQHLLDSNFVVFFFASFIDITLNSFGSWNTPQLLLPKYVNIFRLLLFFLFIKN